MLRILHLAFLCLLLIPRPALAAKHALLIGISEYSASGLSDLSGTLNDVHLVADMLHTRFGFQANEIHTLLNANATHTRIRDAFGQLAQEVQPDDQVYIHYAGHGSTTPDLNGEEQPFYVGGKACDSTWVPFGSRSSASLAAASDPDNLDYFDILDDELNAWLAPIYDKTDNVIFVSDSCHSGSVTRGDAPKVRGAVLDERPHPLGRMPAVSASQKGIRIGAARDDQEAGEYSNVDGSVYGLFTWYWVRALNITAPGDTWDMVFKRAVAMIGATRERQQHPQMEGTGRRIVFDAKFAPLQATVPVAKVSSDGSEVILRVGTFCGITEGSTYRIDSTNSTFVITSAQPFSSIGRIEQGSIQAGDLAVEEMHVYPYEPLKLYIRADLPQDLPYAEALANKTSTLPGYATTTSQQDCDLMILVIRPKRNNGDLVMDAATSTLPQQDPDASPEIWLLDANECPTRENLRMTPKNIEDGTRLTCENLQKLSRVREILRLGVTGTGGIAPVVLTVVHYQPDDTCRTAEPECLDIPNLGRYRQTAALPAEELDGTAIQVGDFLTFRVENTSPTDLYCYLLDITDKGQIAVICPYGEDSAETVLVPAKQSRDFTEFSGTLVETIGGDTIKLIASQSPLDVTLFSQSALSKGATRNGSHPLENFLAHSMTNQTRGPFSTRPTRSNWGTVQFSYRATQK